MEYEIDNRKLATNPLVFICCSFMAVAMAEFFFVLVGLYWGPPVFEVPWRFGMLAVLTSVAGMVFAGYGVCTASRMIEKMWAMVAGLSSLGAFGFSIWILWRICVVSSKFVFF